MPQLVGTALSGLEAGLGSAVTGVENAASGLYRMLPSLGSLAGGGTAPSAAPTSVDPVTGIASLAPGSVAPTGTMGAPTAGPAGVPSMPGPNPIAAIAQALEMYQRYNMQQNLQDPNYVARQIQKLQQPLSKNLVSGITKQVEAQAQERGLGGAPGLFQQALAEALAPYTFAEQNQATQEYFDALGLSQREYPAGGGYGDFAQELAQGAQAFGF